MSETIIDIFVACSGACVVAYLACALAAAVASGWVDETVRIRAPLAAVWAYGSDSRRAAEWSVFFDHITPIEGDGLPPDGAIGAERICYRNADERGPHWYETTVAATPLAHRQIHTYDLREFQAPLIAHNTEYEVHQHYTRVDDATTDLRFRSRMQRRPGVRQLVMFPVLKTGFLIVAHETGVQGFIWNLENIAAAVEARHEGRPYVRPNPWVAVLPWEAKPVRWWLANVLAPGLRPSLKPLRRAQRAT